MSKPVKLVAKVVVPVADNVVNRPVDAVVAPIDILLMVPAVVGLSVIAPLGLKLTDVLADSVVNAPVDAVVAPTVPLMLIDAVPVKLVTVPLDGVPSDGVVNEGLVENTKLPEPVNVEKLVNPQSHLVL